MSFFSVNLVVLQLPASGQKTTNPVFSWVVLVHQAVLVVAGERLNNVRLVVLIAGKRLKKMASQCQRMQFIYCEGVTANKNTCYVYTKLHTAMFVHLDGSLISAERLKNKLQLTVRIASGSTTVIADKRLNKKMKYSSSYVVSAILHLLLQWLQQQQ